MRIRVEPIGTVHSPFLRPEDIPGGRCVDPAGFDDIEGELEVFPRYEQGLSGLEGFSHLIVLFLLHRSSGMSLTARPPHDGRERGVFATRSPNRPNSIGMTVVRLIGRSGRVLRVSGLDMIEGTPILDIKPYTLRDRKPDIRLGWLEPFKTRAGPGER